MRSLLIALGLIACSSTAEHTPIAARPEGNTIATRFTPPTGYTRVEAPAGSFAAYLRSLPLKPAGSAVHLYNGALKGRQDVHAAVIDLSVGTSDLQQCADAVMRLRAEYLFAQDRFDAIAFDFTNGFRAEFSRWANGERIRVQGNACSWVKGGKPGRTHDDLLAYLQQVFMYAGTLSLQRELDRSNPKDLAASDIQAGDVFIQGGSPGHAMMVVDVAIGADGRKAFLLAQSYMPAQEVHVVRDLDHPELGAWYILGNDDRLPTPEWTFDRGDLRRW